jgi:hypothetical protein
MVGIVVLSKSALIWMFLLGTDNLHNLTQLQLVQNGGLSGCVEPYHQDSHFFLSP